MLRGKHKKVESLADKRTSLPLKTPSIVEHTAKIEQKLTYLKQKISEKKRKSVADKTTAVQTTLLNFINRIGMNDYLNVLIENGIDSFEILKEIKQSQLEQIGILKGHALKIVVQIRKQYNRISQQIYAQTTIEIAGVDEANANSKRAQANLTNFNRLNTNIKLPNYDYAQIILPHNFCSQNCELLYQNMFSKYESNLQKAQQNFIPKQHKKSQQLSDNQQFLQNFDFLFNPQINDFDSQQYEQIKQLIKK